MINGALLLYMISLKNGLILTIKLKKRACSHENLCKCELNAH